MLPAYLLAIFQILAPMSLWNLSWSWLPGQIFLSQVHITLLQIFPLGVIIHLFVQLANYCLPQHIGTSKAVVICFFSTHNNICKTKYCTMQWGKVNTHMSSKWIVKGINKSQMMVWLHFKAIQNRSSYVQKLFKDFSITLYQTLP